MNCLANFGSYNLISFLFVLKTSVFFLLLNISTIEHIAARISAKTSAGIKSSKALEFRKLSLKENKTTITGAEIKANSTKGSLFINPASLDVTTIVFAFIFLLEAKLITTPLKTDIPLSRPLNSRAVSEILNLTPL